MKYVDVVWSMKLKGCKSSAVQVKKDGDGYVVVFNDGKHAGTIEMSEVQIMELWCAIAQRERISVR